MSFLEQRVCHGLGSRNPDGSLIAIDDPRWDPIWQACGRLGLPIIIHTADPAAFFLAIDEQRLFPNASLAPKQLPVQDVA